MSELPSYKMWSEPHLLLSFKLNFFPDFAEWNDAPEAFRLNEINCVCVFVGNGHWRAAMSLYDDLGVAASDTKTEGWSKNFKLLQSQLKVKKAALTQAKVGTQYISITV